MRTANSTSLLVILLATVLLIGGCVLSQRSLQLEAWHSMTVLVRYFTAEHEAGRLSYATWKKVVELKALAEEALERWEAGDLNAQWVFHAILGRLLELKAKGTV